MAVVSQRPISVWTLLDKAIVVVLISSYLVLVFLVPVLLSLVVSYRSLPRGPACGNCAREAVPLQHRWARLLPWLRLERRWCLHCGWEGMTRGRAPVQVRLEVSPRPEPAASGNGTALDVRVLRVDGRTWRVQLQCWKDQRLCYGRLVFIEPTGRSWADAVQSFSGTTQTEVLGQALSVPDRQLASRLRQLLIAES